MPGFFLIAFTNTTSLRELLVPELRELPVRLEPPVLPVHLELPQEPVLAPGPGPVSLQLLPVSALLPFCILLPQTIMSRRKAGKEK